MLYRIRGEKGGGSSLLDTVVNATDYVDAESFAVNLGWEGVSVLKLNYAVPSQYDTPNYTMENDND